MNECTCEVGIASKTTQLLECLETEDCTDRPNRPVGLAATSGPARQERKTLEGWNTCGSLKVLYIRHNDAPQKNCLGRLAHWVSRTGYPCPIQTPSAQLISYSNDSLGFSIDLPCVPILEPPTIQVRSLFWHARIPSRWS